MPSNSYPLIAREGWPVLLALLIIVVLSYYYFGDIVATLAGILFCFSLFLLRDPEQVVPSQPLALVSPVQGTVVSVDTIDDPWLTRHAIGIRIIMSFLDIYSLRSPIEGKIMNQWSLHNRDTTGRKFAFWVKTDEDDDVVVSVHLNLFAAFCFRFYGHSGERIGHGQRCGYLYFGGIIDVLVPENSKIQVKPGEHISSGSGILAQLVHAENATVIRDTDQAHGGEISIPAH
jgi:phosphatidylserine decarboxylase